LTCFQSFLGFGISAADAFSDVLLVTFFIQFLLY